MSRHTLTFYGGVIIDDSLSKIGKGSYKFNGSSSYITSADSDDWDFGTNNFTIECWLYHIADIAYSGLINSAHYDIGGITGWCIDLGAAGNQVRFVTSASGSWAADLVSNTTVALNSWTHIAVVRVGDNIYLLENGFITNSKSGVAAWNFTSSGYGIYIGRIYDNLDNYYLSGYLDESRISNTNRWSGEFPPQTTPYTPDANTLLLLHSEGDISDSVNDHPITIAGTPQLNGLIIPGDDFFGSMYFNGSTDYLSVLDSADWSFGSDDFTIDEWIRLSSLPTGANYTIWMQRVDGSNVHQLIYYDNAGTLTLNYAAYSGGSPLIVLTYEVEFSLNTWYHIASVRDGNTFRLFTGGIVRDTDTYAGSMPDLAAALEFGRNSAGSNFFHGYQTEMRVSITARWSTDYIPPTKPYSLGG